MLLCKRNTSFKKTKFNNNYVSKLLSSFIHVVFNFAHLLQLVIAYKCHTHCFLVLFVQSYCLKVKEMDDEEYSYAALQEPLYRVETGNYEYR